MNNITFIVNGDPFGKQRPRTFTNKRGVVRTMVLRKFTSASMGQMRIVMLKE